MSGGNGKSNAWRIYEKDVTCPYYKRCGPSSLVCEGMTQRQSVSIRFGSAAARSAWAVSYCFGYGAGRRCPYAAMLDGRYGLVSPPREREVSDISPGTGAGGLTVTRSVTVVSNPPRIRAFALGKSARLELPRAGIYDAVFAGIRDGDVVFARLIERGNRDGDGIVCRFRRGVSDGSFYPYGEDVYILYTNNEADEEKEGENR